jgi:hypothetical protein
MESFYEYYVYPFNAKDPSMPEPSLFLK